MVKQYNDLFIESKILERIIPRQVDDASMFQDFNQFVCRDEDDFKESDLDAVNQVSSFLN